MPSYITARSTTVLYYYNTTLTYYNYMILCTVHPHPRIIYLYYEAVNGRVCFWSYDLHTREADWPARNPQLLYSGLLFFLDRAFLTKAKDQREYRF
jgi:hypothetical protein